MRILDFAADFSVYDINYDGVVSDQDIAPILGDGDNDRDGDVDLADVAGFQRCFSRPGVGGTFCAPVDLTGDDRVDRHDVRAFFGSLTGPLGQ